MLLLPNGLDAEQRQTLMRQVHATPWSEIEVESSADDLAEPIRTRWILATSGTTGTPKLVEHTLESLTRSASFDVRIGAQHTWSSLYNLRGFAGLQVFLQAWCGGSRFVMHRGELSLAERIHRMARHGATALSATPTMWRKLLMTGGVESMPLKRITLGGEIADQKILDALADSFSGVKIRHIYASTEVGVGFSVRDGRAGFPVNFLDQAQGNVRLRVREGRLWLKSDGPGGRFVQSSPSMHDEDDFIDTGDLVVQNGDRFEFLGRAGGAINVGGNKVQPEEIERFLLGLDPVAEARVHAKKSPFTGSIVAVDIVPADSVDAATVRKVVTKACRAELPAYKVPAMIRVVDSIATNANGKVMRSTAA
ncbi:ANL family adenylate-forming protein [Crateriforma spongiae]|uniref:ANL family adenylate-forming protein n=1 Tax=Crateriforma spongiae TaxID=2724528 RepID=UPI0039B04B9F